MNQIVDSYAYLLSELERNSVRICLFYDLAQTHRERRKKKEALKPPG
jgi:hypothetical protein